LNPRLLLTRAPASKLSKIINLLSAEERQYWSSTNAYLNKFLAECEERAKELVKEHRLRIDSSIEEELRAELDKKNKEIAEKDRKIEEVENKLAERDIELALNKGAKPETMIMEALSNSQEITVNNCGLSPSNMFLHR